MSRRIDKRRAAALERERRTDQGRAAWRKLTSVPERIASPGEMEMPCECCDGKIFVPAVDARANYVVHSSPACVTFLKLDVVSFMREVNKRLRIKLATKNGIGLA